MSQVQVARRYAEALADAASARNELAAVAGDLSALAALVASNKELAYVFETPAVSSDDKLKVVNALVSAARPHELVANMLRVLVHNNRLYLVRLIDKAFASEVDARSGVIAADVTTAKPLTSAEQEVLARTLDTMTGRKVKLGFATDDGLIGGVVTRIGSKIYDGSIRAKLDAVKRQMIGGTRA